MALSNPIVLIATVTLIMQIVVLFLVLYGYANKRKQQFRRHGKIMTTAVIAHSVMIFAVMIPSLVLLSLLGVLEMPLTMALIASVIHGLTGAVAVTLGLWLVGAWRLSEDISGCIRRKKFMWPTLAVWVTAIFFGIILYIIFYGASLA
jgi:uncharacterized membrane protein YozB (DUF420 family)